MLKPIFTLDYEIHGNGEGCPLALMVEPTHRLLRLFEEYGAKLTIMADVAEILKFKEYCMNTGRDDFHSNAIESQLRESVERGHDVQLHIHSSYFRAQYDDKRWLQDWTEYNFAELPFDRMDWMIRQGKEYLESLLRPADPSYRCEVFRAANWSVSPSQNVVKALISNGIQADTSVFKYGRRRGLVQFDYANAASALIPWRVRADDVSKSDDSGQLWEFPIYAEARGIYAFFTVQRLYRVLGDRIRQSARRIPMATAVAGKNERSTDCQKEGRKRLFGTHAWKADFNQCTGRQLISAMNRAEAQFDGTTTPLPFVLIGHSKLFSRFNEFSLRTFLNYVRRNPQRFQFGSFRDFLDCEDYRLTPMTAALGSKPCFQCVEFS